MQQFYQRKVSTKLAVLRITSGILLVLAGVSFRRGPDNLGWLMSTLLAILAFARVTGLWIAKEEICLRRYYLWGLLPLTYRYIPGNPAWRLELVDKRGENELLTSAEDIGCLFALLPLRYRFRGMILRSRSSPRFIAADLSEEEHTMISKLAIESSVSS